MTSQDMARLPSVYFAVRYLAWREMQKVHSDADAKAAAGGYLKSKTGLYWGDVAELITESIMKVEDDVAAADPVTAGDFAIKIEMLLCDDRENTDWYARIKQDARDLLSEVADQPEGADHVRTDVM